MNYNRKKGDGLLITMKNMKFISVIMGIFFKFSLYFINIILLN